MSNNITTYGNPIINQNNDNDKYSSYIFTTFNPTFEKGEDPKYLIFDQPFTEDTIYASHLNPNNKDIKDETDLKFGDSSNKKRTCIDIDMDYTKRIYPIFTKDKVFENKYVDNIFYFGKNSRLDNRKTISY
jgi:hypothetical protein